MSRPYTVEQLKALASLLRKALGFQTTKRLNMRVVLTKFRQLYPDFNYLVVKDDELPDAEAKYDPTTRLLKIADRTFKALENGSPRAAFTIAHELGHPILQHTEIRFRHAERKVYERAKPNIYREEREADQFAAFLLAPDHLAEGCRTVEDFMRTFGLGRRAAEIRKEQYDRDLRRKASVRSKFDDLPGFGEADPLRPGAMLPQLDAFVAEVTRFYSDRGKVDRTTLLSYLDVPGRLETVA